jgi:predicted transcriptional regulator of viral defense system
VKAGILERVARGQYRMPARSITEHHALAVAVGAVPQGVICLLSALSFHGIGTQVPFEIWIAIDRRSRRPALKYPPLHVVHFSGPSFTEGIEVHEIEGRPVRVYSAAKTVADLFKFRNKIGLEVALEALRESWQRNRASMNEIDRYARVCRVSTVMKPFLEMLVS